MQLEIRVGKGEDMGELAAPTFHLVNDLNLMLAPWPLSARGWELIVLSLASLSVLCVLLL